MARNSEKKSGNNQFMLLLLGILIILIVVSVVIVCIYSFMKRDNSSNTITNTITMNYTSTTNGIVIPYTSIYDDATGKLLQNDENVFDFVVNAKVKKGTKVKYKILAEKDDLSSISDDKVRIYLQKSDVSSYSSVKEVLLPQKYSIKDNSFTDVSGMVLDSGIYSKTSTVYYRLKLWIDPSYVSNSDNDYFKIKVSIYADTK